MSYSFRLPEEDPICECKYDEVRDRMDRDDCHFHCEMVDESDAEVPAERKPPTSARSVPPRPEVNVVR
jgi:hypothetical protein